MPKRLLPLAALALALACAGHARAQDQRPAAPRLVTVTGEAEILVVPDEVVFDVTVQTFNRDLRLAKSQTDGRLKSLIALARKHGVAERDLQTDYVNIGPRYRGGDEARTLLGYAVRKDLTFTLRDVAQAEGLLSEVIESGVNRVNSVTFRTSQLRKHRDEARARAMRAAREKAAALASEIGQSIGKAHSIEEDVPAGRAGMQNAAANYTGFVGGEAAESEGTLALGQIRIVARVTVRFELN